MFFHSSAVKTGVSELAALMLQLPSVTKISTNLWMGSAFWVFLLNQ